jgi:hypothetical protein
MITITEKDTNLSLIMKEGKFFNLVTRLKYHVFGLKQENNSPILIQYEKTYADIEFISKVKSLVKFFKLNEIEVELNNASKSRQIDIGLRIDVRTLLNTHKKPLFAVSVLSTIIYCFEGRVDIEQMKKYKVSSLPKLNPKIITTA